MRISDWSSDVCSSDLQVRRVLPVSERRTCRVLVQHRSTQRHHPKDDAEEQRLTADIIALAKDYGRYGYRSIHALLGHAGWQISLSVVERIWRREGLKVPKKQPKRHACGSATDHASGCARSIVVMSGPTTSLRIKRTTAENTGCSTS